MNMCLLFIDVSQLIAAFQRLRNREGPGGRITDIRQRYGKVVQTGLMFKDVESLKVVLCY